MSVTVHIKLTIILKHVNLNIYLRACVSRAAINSTSNVTDSFVAKQRRAYTSIGNDNESLMFTFVYGRGAVEKSD